ncbi:MAG: metallophosphoesterase [Paracoccaceae bacterium]|jgi:serine/threonine protein phosphatase 1|nr:metallophosphoesterase [Paracoccaceae bacterium]MDP7186465.1 metallophosphoesterase [Paracoccaceae bacterium]
MQPLYVIPDIHGHADKLAHALDLIEADGGPDAKIVFLGDYIDRGPDSKGVLQHLIDGHAAGRNWTFLKGNHDRLMAYFFADPMLFDAQFLIGYSWFHERLGGIETLASYGVEVREGRRHSEVLAEARQAVPQSHLDFINGLTLTHLAGECLFVHAGIRPEVALERQIEQDLVWIREEFHDYRKPHPWLVVHGHTVVPQPTHYGNRINLDAGAGYGRPLAAAVIEGRDCWLLTDTGRAPIGKARD